MHNNSVYELDYPDGTTEQLIANIIAENMLKQVDPEGHHYQVMTELTNQNRDDSNITKVNGFIKSSKGNLHQQRTTRGCKLLVEWKYVSVYWFSLKGLKQSN